MVETMNLLILSFKYHCCWQEKGSSESYPLLSLATITLLYHIWQVLSHMNGLQWNKLCVDSNTCWARAQVFHPALTEINNKFSGDCSSAGCGLRCFIQSLSNQLAFLLIRIAVRSGPQQKRYSHLGLGLAGHKNWLRNCPSFEEFDDYICITESILKRSLEQWNHSYFLQHMPMHDSGFIDMS